MGSGNTATCLTNREWRCGVDVRGSDWASFLRTRKVLMVRASVSLVSLVRECVRPLCFVEVDFRGMCHCKCGPALISGYRLRTNLQMHFGARRPASEIVGASHVKRSPEMLDGNRV